MEKYKKFGIRNCVKGYCPGQVFTADEWLPVFGYVKGGEIVDTMYEATTIMPNPYWIYHSPHLKDCAGWENWIKNTFANLDNINEAMGRIKKAIGRADYRLKVFPTVADCRHNGKWGDIDSVKMEADNPDHDFMIVKYLVERYIEEFEKRQYEHVELTGYYWFHESLEDKIPWYRRVTDYIHSLGLLAMISPFYKADRYQLCYEAGFDLVSMQSNYFPLWTIGYFSCGPIERLDNNMVCVKNLGYGLEPEICSSGQEHITGYKETLKRGAQYGIMQTYNLHYWQKPMMEACYSDDPYIRSCYDDLYKYIHCKLNPDEVWIKPVETPQHTMDVQLLHMHGDLPTTAEEWLPIIAHRKDGVIDDTMMTRLCLSPDPQALYSVEFSTKAGWDAWTDRVFKSLDALNEAVGQVKEALNDSERTVDVMFALPSCYNPDSDPHFYDNWGDGLNPNDPDDRFEMVKHLIDTYPTRLRSGQYPHLKFFGYRWIEPFVRAEQNDWYLRTTDYIRTKFCFSLIEPDDGRENGCYRAGFEYVVLRFDETNAENAVSAKFRGMGVQRHLSSVADLDAAIASATAAETTNELQTYWFADGKLPAEGSDLYEALHTYFHREKK